MAVYKVPQDVEAEDKLIGPFSFRQFIYLIVAALGIFLAWALSQVFIGLLILPLPIVVAMLALALPLRKDQPMETYLIAMIKFFFKPRQRMWDPEGTISLVQITAPKVAEGPELKNFGGAEASQRLAYLAQVVDTRGWATRGAMSANDSLSDIFIAEASQAVDVLDENSGVAQSLDQRMNTATDARLQAAREQMMAQLNTPQPAVPTQPPTDAAEPDLPTDLHYDPYPNAMHQRVVQPAAAQPPTPAPQPVAPSPQPQAQAQKDASDYTVSPDIMRLANNNDLSISALAHEAQRLRDTTDDEVVISLR